MANKELDKWLATEVVGYELKPCTCGSCNVMYWFDKNTHTQVMYEKDWHPTEDIKQAFMCLDKLKVLYVIGNLPDDKAYFCRIHDVPLEHIFITDTGITLSEAICNAIKKAKTK